MNELADYLKPDPPAGAAPPAPPKLNDIVKSEIFVRLKGAIQKIDVKDLKL